MQSYTTQQHQRNYQGKVVLPTPIQATANQPKQHKALGKIATSALVLTIVTMGSLLGATTLHNQPTHRQINVAAAQVTEFTVTDDHTAKRTNDGINYGQYYQTKIRGEHDENDHRERKYPRRPISNQRHETEPMPSLDSRNNYPH